jgi:hypothetical protein
MRMIATESVGAWLQRLRRHGHVNLVIAAAAGHGDFEVTAVSGNLPRVVVTVLFR